MDKKQKKASPKTEYRILEVKTDHSLWRLNLHPPISVTSQLCLNMHALTNSAKKKQKKNQHFQLRRSYDSFTHFAPSKSHCTWQQESGLPSDKRLWPHETVRNPLNSLCHTPQQWDSAGFHTLRNISISDFWLFSLTPLLKKLVAVQSHASVKTASTWCMSLYECKNFMCGGWGEQNLVQKSNFKQHSPAHSALRNSWP